MISIVYLLTSKWHKVKIEELSILAIVDLVIVSIVFAGSLGAS